MGEEIDVGMKCIKYMLFVANFMFVMIGFLLISIGSTIKAIYGDFEVFIANHYFSPALLAIAIGVIIFFVALFGCVGAVKESTCLINLFGFFLAVCLILEVSAAIAAYAMRSELESTIRKNMEYSIKDYKSVSYDQDAWDFMQSRLYCCGIDSYTDWEVYFPPSPSVTTTTAASTIPDFPISATWPGPSSCCYKGDKLNNQCKKAELFKDGCLDSLSYIVSESALLLGCGALAVAFIQLLGVIFAWMLAKAVRRLKTQQVIDRDQDRQRNYEQFSKDKLGEIQTPVLYTPTFSEA